MTFDLNFFVQALTRILAALPLTLAITLAAFLLAALIGSGVAAVRARRLFLLYPLARAYVSIIRGTPGLLHLMIISLALPAIIEAMATRWGLEGSSTVIPLACFVTLALAMTGGAYMAEIVRAGILAVPPGQVEAAQAVGMNHWQLMHRIVLPQAAAASLPSLCNLYIGLLQGSSLAYLVSVQEMTGTAVVLASQEWKYLESYVAVALLYWAMTIVMERATVALERRWKALVGGGYA